ncbi:DsrE family protein [Antarcticibacterium arcticum]|uniref:DsrE family protein n=1 Tax=Antarcticibacterium arcticum TaxID=2585771 RepID=A0A5B8YHX8_9FLAO|nr:DsrE family protein [Antarcticibacterium arcticum]QED37542.1 DsrE family protein [Antarcticibacterium arcticum]
MIKNLQLLCFLGFLIIFSEGFAQEQTASEKPIANFGPTYPIENPDYKTSLSEEYKVVFDVSKPAENPAEVNKYVETVARFLNMHVEAGKPLNSMKVYLIMHGGAAQTLLKNEHYKEIFKTDNPNIPLFEALREQGVEILLCGQTSFARNISEERRIPETKISLSAMTALIQLQNEGYRLIQF